VKAEQINTLAAIPLPAPSLADRIEAWKSVI